MDGQRIDVADRREAELAKARVWKAANKERVKAARAAYYQANKEKERASRAAWLAAHPESLAVYRARDAESRKTPEGREKAKARRLKDADKIRQRNREYYANDVRQTLRIRLTTLLNQALRRYKFVRAAPLSELLGCTMPELIAHLEAGFKPGMSWERKSEIDIDHIRPICSFDWSDPEQQRACFHHSNLQLLWHHENMAKGSRINS